MGSQNTITVYEHEKLTLKSERKFTPELYHQLEKYYGTEGCAYFSLIRNGVKFNQYVGVIQVGNVSIEVLPKTDRSNEKKATWRNVLIQMLRITSGIEATATSKSKLRLKSNSIFDLYIELFIKECEKLTHRGLVKKYRRVKENQTALKGRLHIPGQIRDNIIHKERFHVEYSKFDQNHLINQILNKTLNVLTHIPIRFDLRSRVKRQLLYFEHIEDCSVNEAVFDKIFLNRKTERYTIALEIARLILLNYHPDISKGNNHVLALMFDMNQLWEKFIAKLMKRNLSETYKVKSQSSKIFWQSNRSRKRLKPDILLSPKRGDQVDIVIDTKWKTPPKLRPSDDDLRQIFAYNQLFKAQQGVLLYPGSNLVNSGSYNVDERNLCSAMLLQLFDSNGNLQLSKSLFDPLINLIENRVS